MLRSRSLPENHGGLTEVGKIKSTDRSDNYSVCTQQRKIIELYPYVKLRLTNREKTDTNSALIAPAIMQNEDGWHPVPAVLTPKEAAKYLRLDAAGCKNPLQTLRYYREKKKLQGTRIGKQILYTRKALDEFLEKMTK